MRKTVLFIASSGRNVGKTSISIGLFDYFKKQNKKVAFVKPVAQHYTEFAGFKISRDVILLNKIYKYLDDERLHLASPFVIESGFTKSYILGEAKSPKPQIKRAFEKILEEFDVVLVEGTGHPGVGSCINLSNAAVARMLNANTLLILEGGIGNTIDNYTLAKSVFKSAGWSVDGVIINKVKEEKYEEIDRTLKKFFRGEDVYYLGTIPFVHELSMPSLRLICDTIDAKILQREDLLTGKVNNMLMAINEPHIFLEEIERSKDENIILTTGDREDILMAIYAIYNQMKSKIKALILSSTLPHERIMKLYNDLPIPVIYTQNNIFKTASLISGITVKIDPYESEKIKTLQNLFEEFIDESQLKRFVNLATRDIERRGFKERVGAFFKFLKSVFKG
jgi:BioD-like phosphotransacetylase family protein